MGHKGLVGAKKSKDLKFELGEKLDHYSWVKFRGESNGDSLVPLKRCLDPEMANNGLIWAKNRKILNFSLEKS